jgi:hypothetical protein
MRVPARTPLTVTGNLTGFALSGWGPTIYNYFGKSLDDTVRGLNGTIDEILVSCRSYTADEIRHLAYLPP